MANATATPFTLVLPNAERSRTPSVSTTYIYYLTRRVKQFDALCQKWYGESVFAEATAMTELLTLSEIADQFAGHGDQKDTALFLRQLRHLDTHGLIKASPSPRDGRGTAQFDRREMVIGRLLVAASDHNMTRSDLAWLRTVIDHGRTTLFPETGNYEINLDAIIPRIRQDETWLIQLASARGTEAEARTTLSQWIRLQADGRRNQFGDLYPDPLSPGVLLGDRRPIEIVTYIHATNLLLPLIATET